MRSSARHHPFITRAALAVSLAVTPVVALAATSSGTPGRPAGRGAAGSVAAPALPPPLDDSVHLNQVQVVGTHNSYHLIPPPNEVAIRKQFIDGADDQIEYRHAELPVQFQSQKIRQIELDVWLDSKGGLYANPLLRQYGHDGPYHPDVMDKPGIKVLHIQDVDYANTCLTLKLCLAKIKAWSDANPSHMPIAVLLELKDDPLSFGNIQFTKPEPWTTAGMDTLDAEIRSVLPPSTLITPDDVRGSHPTLNDAVLTTGWPTLNASRGKLLFLMDNASRRDAYLAGGHDTLQGRVLFTNSVPGAPDAAFLERNDPSDKTIPALVKAGYVVRTRADADTEEARKNETDHRDEAFASGAQWVSTDYPVPHYDVGFDTPYFAEIPGGTVARCDPVNAPPTCVSRDIDTIYTPIAPPPTSPPTSTTAPPATAPAEGSGEAPGASPVAGTSRFTG